MICEEIYNNTCKKFQIIVDKLKGNGQLSFTTDAWSDPSAGVALLSLIARGIVVNFERVNLVLSAETLTERYTGEYISEKFDDMLKKWSILPQNVYCVVRDSGANMKKALFQSGLNNLDCTIHKIQLVIKSGISSQKAFITLFTNYDI